MPTIIYFGHAVKRNSFVAHRVPLEFRHRISAKMGSGLNPEATKYSIDNIYKEGFYQKNGFRKMLTGMALFKSGAAMRERGFTE